jgi:hypothetical protein
VPLCSVEYRPDDELHEHKLTVLYRKALRDTLLPHLHSTLQQAGVEATVIEGGAGETRRALPCKTGVGCLYRCCCQMTAVLMAGMVTFNMLLRSTGLPHDWASGVQLHTMYRATCIPCVMHPLAPPERPGRPSFLLGCMSCPQTLASKGQHTCPSSKLPHTTPSTPPYPVRHTSSSWG